MLHHIDKKSQNREKDLETEQKHVGLTCKRLITPAKTLFAYQIHYFRYLLENRVSINYLYGSMETTSMAPWKISQTE